MDPTFARAIEHLEMKLTKLKSMAPMTRDAIRRLSGGVYLFTENGTPLYVGRSNNISLRYRNHCSGMFNQAAFAMRLAYESTQRERDYSRGSRERRESDPLFCQAFASAKARICAMDFRAVDESDPTRQALLEIYCAIALGCRYNDFDNH
jgi:hypothetical protein